jgi:membrane-associated phospholipid phosphatase
VLEREQILTRRQARALRIGLPLLIGVDRVYVREHWFTDVLGGWALGAAVGFSVVAASAASPPSPSRASSPAFASSE